jgi:hypothetical protein
MFDRRSIGAIALATALGVSGANAFDDSQYPDWSGQWQRALGVGFQWDPSKPLGRGQQAPLTAEYQAVFEASLADQADGGQGGDLLYTCLPVGMPRVMTGTWPFEFVVLPKITYLNFETNRPRRIYTDSRSFPTDEEPSFMGYSIGRWLDEDGDGRYDTLAVERPLEGEVTRKIIVFKGRKGLARETLDLSPGAHMVRVQVESGGFDETRRIRGTFKSGETRRMDANVGGILTKSLKVGWGS